MKASDSNRNYGIDALRILAMYMVCMLHVLGENGGGVLLLTKGSKNELMWLMESFAYCAVNCYALISGYVGMNVKYKYNRIIMLWFKTVFYTVGIIFLCQLIYSKEVSFEMWVDALFPVTRQQYWYLTAYFGLFFLMPLLNVCLQYMERNTLKNIFILLIIFSVLPNIVRTDIFEVHEGYSVLWLLILYLLGGYIKKFGLFHKLSIRKLIFGYIICVGMTWFLKVAIHLASQILFHVNKFGTWSYSYTFPTVVLSSIFLFLAFERMFIPDRIKKLVLFFSPLTFSVYLIHANPLVWQHLLINSFAGYVGLPVGILIMVVLLGSFVIFIICSLIDYVRIIVIQHIHLKEKFLSLENKLKCSIIFIMKGILKVPKNK